jgi:tRNA-splicing ligase RtcB (3'-phosphate/5'-hydroxy nucleic acid ligase)
MLHRAVAERVRAEPGERFSNEHNFVFRRGDVFLHGKGATPAWGDYAEDASGLTLIPLNMAEQPMRWVSRPGRNVSRSEHMRRMEAVTPAQKLATETAGLNIRFHGGAVDALELPSSYKRAGAVTERIRAFGLAEVVDCIDPCGCVMAGDIPPHWKTRRGRG